MECSTCKTTFFYLPTEHKGMFRLSARTACLLYLCVCVCTVVTEVPTILRKLLDTWRNRYEEAQKESTWLVLY